ncbi:MAG: AsmA-like C-terminal domain-containing protein [Hellea sp.]
MTENPSADNAIEPLSGGTAAKPKIVAAHKPSHKASGKPSGKRSKGWSYWPRRIGYRLFRLSGELTAIVLGLAIFWFFALNVLLTQQSVDISAFKPNAQMWFSEAFNGSDAQIGEMELAWLPASNNIVFTAANVAITDKDGNQINTIPSMQTEIPLSAAAKGALMPERLMIDGGAVTWLRGNDGGVIAGLGTPDTVGRLGPVWRGGGGEAAARPDVSGIKTLKVTNATAYFVDDSDGLELTLKDTNIDFTHGAELITVDMTSKLRKDAVSIPLDFKMRASPNVKSYTIDLTAVGLNPSVISPKRGRFAGLKTLNTSLDIKAVVKVDEAVGLETADVDLTAGKGQMEFGGQTARFDYGRFKAKLTADSQIMEVLDIAFKSPKVSFAGTGQFSELGALTDGNINSSPVFDLKLTDVNVDQTPQFEAPLLLKALNTSGRLDFDSRRLDLDNLTADFGTYKLSMQGAAQQTPQGEWESIVLNGGATGTLSHKDLLAIWPVKFADGARRWLERSILRATLHNLEFRADFPQEVLSGASLPSNENVDLTFDLTGGDVRYISTMTPYTNTSGRGIVRGNSARFEALGGSIGNVTVKSAIADIPRLQPKGGDLNIKVIGEGAAPDLIGLIDEKPFEYASKYGVNPKDFSGTGQIEVNVTRPMLVNFDRNRIKYGVTGKFENVSAPFSIGPHKLKNGFVTMTVDGKSMTVKGPVNIGPWQADLNWQETFDYGATPTRYKVQGRMDRDTLDGLGIGFREYFDGEIGLSVDAIGTGLDLTSAMLTADLTDTSMHIGEYWRKEKGSQGQFTGELKRQPSGGVLFEDMTITAPGFDVRGRVELAQNFRLLDLDLKRANIEGFIEAGVQAKPDELDEKLSVFVTGKYLDLSPFVTRAFQNTEGSGFDVPILLTAGLEKLALNEAYIIENANMLFAHNGEGVTNARLAGRTGDGDFKVDMLTQAENAVRNVTVDIPNASEAAFAFLGLDNITGGRLQINAQLPPVGVKGALNGVADLEDFKLVEAPILAQMLSIASLQGIFDTLGGEGLNFEEFIVPFSWEEGALNIRNARVSGPALGMTGNGEIRLTDRSLDLDGALVPAYTANSMLGDIPVIGDIFVGKKGEGIFALSYTVKGSFNRTQIAVNPLSALTPGFLRGIFRTKRDKLPEGVVAEIEAVVPEE